MIKKKWLLMAMVVCVFFPVVLDSISFYIESENYLLFWYPIIVTSTSIFLSTYILLSAILLKSCFYTKAAIFLFWIQQWFTLSVYLIPIDYKTYVFISKDIILFFAIVFCLSAFFRTRKLFK